MVALDRRDAERRTGRPQLRWPDRRTGFDRRSDPSRRRRIVEEYASRPVVVGAVVGLIVLLNAADLVLTMRALDRGAVELNPLMAVLLERRPEAAAVLKLAIGAGVAAALWRLRRYRRVLEVSLVFLGGFVALTAYHLIGAVVLSG